MLERRIAAATGQGIDSRAAIFGAGCEGREVREEFLPAAGGADADSGYGRSFTSVSACAEQGAMYFILVASPARRKRQSVFRSGNGAARTASAAALACGGKSQLLCTLVGNYL